MEDLTKHSTDLIAGLKTFGGGLNKLEGYVGQVTIINGCPSNWGVVIVAGGVDFFYTDGSSSADGPRQLNLYSGQSATFTSNDASKCVQRFLAAITVAAPGQPPQNMTDPGSVPQGQCLVHVSVTLGPKQSVSGRISNFSEYLKLSKS